MEILSAEEWIEKHFCISLTKEAKNIDTYSFNDIINMTCGYHSYILEKQAKFISNQFGVNGSKEIIEASNEFIKQRNN